MPGQVHSATTRLGNSVKHALKVLVSEETEPRKQRSTYVVPGALVAADLEATERRCGSAM